jgi:hypothetical protein
MKSKYHNRKSRSNKQNGSNKIEANGIAMDSIHHISTVGPKNSQEAERLTLIYQEKIRQSPLWDEFIRVYGHEMAQKALKECRVIFKNTSG